MPLSHDNEASVALLLKEAGASADARYHHRIHAVLLVLQGRTSAEVGQWFGEHARTIRRWVDQFQTQGPEGLSEAQRPGRPSSLDERKKARLAKDLARGPRAFGFDAQVWDGELLGQHLELRYGIRLGIRQCQRILKTLG